MSSERTGEKTLIDELVVMLWTWWSNLSGQYRERDWPLTASLALVVGSVFLVQVVSQLLLQVPDLRTLNAWLFAEFPAVAWPAAAFLHRDIQHVLVNVLILTALAPVEQYLSRRQYVSLFVVAGMGSTVVGGLYLDHFGTQPHVAFYGVSGFGFALAGFALVYLLPSVRDLLEVDRLSVLIGLSAGIVVLRDVLEGLSDPMLLNPGHVSGYLVGLAAGLFVYWRRAST